MRNALKQASKTPIFALALLLGIGSVRSDQALSTSPQRSAASGYQEGIGKFPLALVDPRLIEELDKAIQERTGVPAPVYFVGVLANGDAVLVDAEGAPWSDIGPEALPKGQVNYVSQDLEYSIEGSITFYHCHTNWFNNCKKKLQ
jgi:hypothetical protein